MKEVCHIPRVHSAATGAANTVDYARGVTAAHPIDLAWLSTGGTGAKNYDEFPDETEITRIIEANPASMLGVEMPAHTPEAVAAGLGFEASLPAAAERLGALKDAGRFAAFGDVAVAYRISGGEEPVAYGVFCLVDTAEISSSAEEPGKVIRNEDVFIEKVKQRNELNQLLRHLLSPVLLLQSSKGEELHAAVAAAIAGAGAPVAADTDESGRVHEVWAIGGEAGEELAALAGDGDLIVADGNHRSLAAQVGGLDRFLAVITTPQSVVIRPYHRLVKGLPGSASQLVEQIGQIGATVAETDGPPETPAAGGTVVMYGQGRTWEVSFGDRDGSVVDRLDHTRVEHEVFTALLGWDAGDKRITYVGGDYPASWLAAQVDAGKADLAILIAPVTVPDFIDVNLQRLKMPRKSTWFVPKARAGLAIAELPKG
ncbi:Uncharacterized conserved protein, DUF1015 family [Glycomyces sambucus]|uniref:Uncharacterized conserved protein, DUF1015 family n=1 Tax=Glycomyces sambucus TaxID=380244 RepID=A0A1G9DSM4_9ACTN|nr:Uncharacterized conserved protein, DUF1015 family [Glycomyces sambucus]